eukprot:4046738-Prymnesium_polylepis.2
MNPALRRGTSRSTPHHRREGAGQQPRLRACLGGMGEMWALRCSIHCTHRAPNVAHAKPCACEGEARRRAARACVWLCVERE